MQISISYSNMVFLAEVKHVFTVVVHT